MATQDRVSSRFVWLLESGMSEEDAWKILSVEILAKAGLVAPRYLESAASRPEGVALGRIPIYESKLVKVIRIDPADDDRIQALLSRARQEAAASKVDAPTESSIIRQAIRLGLDELERQHARR